MILAVSLLAAAFVGNAYASSTRIDVTKVEASSQYPNDSATYHPENAIDGDSSTAWFPQRTERANKGEWIKFYFDGKPTLEKFVITNGWVKSDAVWRGNSRIAKARLTFSDGSDRVVTLFDVKKPIEIDLKNKATEWMQLTIETIYAGQDWNTESGITDVVFLGRHTPPVAVVKGEHALGALASAPVDGSFLWSAGSWPSDMGMVLIGNLYWQDQPRVASEKYDWHQARQACASLKVDFDGLTMGGFRLPTMAEYTGLIEEKLSRHFKHHADRNSDYWAADNRRDGFNTHVASIIRATYWYANKGRSVQDQYHARCVSQGGDLVTKSMVQIAQAMAQDRAASASRLVLPERPASPVPAVEAALTKSEFETSAAFRKRVAAEQDRVRQANAAAEGEYRAALSAWEARVAQARGEHERAAAARGGGTDAYFLDALGKAMAIKYGKPLIKSLHYDADAQAFLVEVGSERGDYAGKAKVAVPLAYAPEVKRLVSKGYLAPELEMSVQNGDVVVRGVRQLSDPAGFIVATLFEFRKNNLTDLQELLASYPDTSQTPKLQARIDELQFKAAFDSVAALESFLRQRPGSAQAMQARERIKELKQRHARKQVEDAEAQKRAAAERERESRLYNAAKDVGDKVCADITTRGLFSSDTYEVSGYVEGKSGGRIQIRIANPRAISSYNGAKLYQGAIIWDHHSNWKACP